MKKIYILAVMLLSFILSDTSFAYDSYSSSSTDNIWLMVTISIITAIIWIFIILKIVNIVKWKIKYKFVISKLKIDWEDKNWDYLNITARKAWLIWYIFSQLGIFEKYILDFNQEQFMITVDWFFTKSNKSINNVDITDLEVSYWSPRMFLVFAIVSAIVFLISIQFSWWVATFSFILLVVFSILYYLKKEINISIVSKWAKTTELVFVSSVIENIKVDSELKNRFFDVMNSKINAIK